MEEKSPINNLNADEALKLPCSQPSFRFASSSLLARNATLNLITEGWIFLVLVVAMPKLVTYLGETAFGLFSLAWVVIGYLSFLDVGVNRAATKFVSEHLAEHDGDSVRQVVRTALAANLALGLFGGVLVTFVSPYLIHSIFKISANLEIQARLVFYGVAFAVPVLLVQGIFRAVLSSYQRFGWINQVNAITVTAQWGVAALLAWKGHGVALVVFVTVIARLIAATTYGILLCRLLPDIRLSETKTLAGLTKLLKFGGWVSISQIISPVLVYLDRILIASFISLGAVTLYTVPFEMMTRLRVIPTSLVATLYPAFSERGAEGQGNGVQRLYEGSVRYLLLLIIPGIVFLVILGPDLLTIWMGNDFARKTSIVLQILGVGVLLNCMANVPYNALQALGRPDVTGIFHLLELPLYVILCVLMIPHWGIAGAALANSIRISLDAILLFWAAHKFCRCSLGSFWRGTFARILILNAILVVALFVVRFSLTSNLWGRLGLGLVAILIYFLAAWIIVIDKSDKPRISDALRTFSGQVAS